MAAVKAQAGSDAARWREEVSLKQAHVGLLLAADKGREADFMGQRVKDLQVLQTASTCQGFDCFMNLLVA